MIASFIKLRDLWQIVALQEKEANQGAERLAAKCTQQWWLMENTNSRKDEQYARWCEQWTNFVKDRSLIVGMTSTYTITESCWEQNTIWQKSSSGEICILAAYSCSNSTISYIFCVFHQKTFKESFQFIPLWFLSPTLCAAEHKLAAKMHKPSTSGDKLEHPQSILTWI